MLNNVVLMGRITADVELKLTQGGTAVTSFSIACDRNYEDKDGNRPTDFIHIVAWRQTAVFIQKYFTKGQMIAIEGRLQVRGYEDKDGNKRTAVDVLAEQVYFADSKKTDAKKTDTSKDEYEYNPADFEESNEDLPF